MSDVRVRIGFRNDLLERLVEESGKRIREICEEIPVAPQTFYALKSLRQNPCGRDGEYRSVATRIAEYFHLPPEVLFPEEIYRILWPSKMEKAFPVERIACLLQSDNQRLRALLPHEFVEDADTKITIEKVLGSLTPREERIIRMRFGIGDRGHGYDRGYAHTLEEIGEDFELTRDRIRQIEAKALRKLRHPSRSKLLRDIGSAT